MSITDTDCRKCGAPMTPIRPVRDTSPIDSMTNRMTITAYGCAKCGYWNVLNKESEITEPLITTTNPEGDSASVAKLHVCTPTPMLRWVSAAVGQKPHRVLQQLWREQFSGIQEWRDVPLAEKG